MEKVAVSITGDHITLVNLLKYASIVNSGGQAGQIINDGLVKINGEIAKEKRKKVRPGDKVSFAGFLLLVQAEANEG